MTRIPTASPAPQPRSRITAQGLHIQRSGRPDALPLVLLPGWAMHHGVFDSLAHRLGDAVDLWRIDLPGHGKSRPLPDASQPLPHWLNALLDAAPARAIWAGWSLGGRLAAQITLDHPQRVAGLVMLASNPQFIRNARWPHGMAPAHFNAFAKTVRTDYEATLMRFLHLQVNGMNNARATLQTLRRRVFEFGRPSEQALQQGLHLLKTLRYDDRFAQIACLTLLLLGERDTLTPPAAGLALLDNLAAGAAVTLPGAGHAPFLSHTDATAAHLKAFIASVAVRWRTAAPSHTAMNLHSLSTPRF